MPALSEFLNKLEQSFTWLKSEMERSLWSYFLHDNPLQVNSLREYMQLLIQDDGIFSGLSQAAEGTEDEIERKKFLLWRNHIIKNRILIDPGIRHLQNSLRKEIEKTQRLVMNKKMNRKEMLSVLVQEPDRERRRMALNAIDDFSEEGGKLYFELVKECNRIARDYGYRSYAELTTSGDRFDVEEIIRLLELFEKHTYDFYLKVLEEIRNYLSCSSLEKWDVPFAIRKKSELIERDLFGPRAPWALEKTLEKIEMPLSSLPIELVQGKEERPDAPTVFSCWWKPFDEYKLLYRPISGRPFYILLFQEFGNLLFDGVNEEQSYILKMESPLMKSTISQLIADLIYNREWIENFFNLSDEWLQQSRETKYFSVVRLRKLAAESLFEIRLFSGEYERPNEEYANLMKKWLLFGTQGNRAWLNNSLLVDAPMSLWRYSLSELASGHIMTSIREKGSKPFSASLGEILKNRLLKNPECLSFKEQMERAVGAWINPENWIDETMQ